MAHSGHAITVQEVASGMADAPAVPRLAAIGIRDKGTAVGRLVVVLGGARKRLGQPSTLPPKAYYDTVPQGARKRGDVVVWSVVLGVGDLPRFMHSLLPIY
jgi:hypothetical protein